MDKLYGKILKDLLLLDFYYDDTGIDPSSLYCVGDPRDIAGFMKLMNTIEEKNRDGSFYIFTSLTGMSELWKDERAVLDFFTFTCPKLYDLNTLAFWVYERDAHSSYVW